MSTYTPEQLEAFATQYEHGALTPEYIDNNPGTPGPYAWLLDVIDDFDQFAADMQAKGITLEQFLKQAVTQYLQAEKAA